MRWTPKAAEQRYSGPNAVPTGDEREKEEPVTLEDPIEPSALVVLRGRPNPSPGR